MTSPSAAQSGPGLIEAAQKGDLAAVERLLARGADIDARDGRGRTALLAATHGNHVAVARALIAAGADVNAKDSIEDSPYLYAGAEGRSRDPQTDAGGRRRPEKHQSLRRHRADPGGASRPSGGGEDPARDRDRQGSRQQARLDRAARGRDPRRRRADAYRDRAAAGRGRRERQAGGSRRCHAAAARQAARALARWCGSWRRGARVSVRSSAHGLVRKPLHTVRDHAPANPVLIQCAQSSRPLSAARLRRRRSSHRRRRGTISARARSPCAARARRSARCGAPICFECRTGSMSV